LTACSNTSPPFVAPSFAIGIGFAALAEAGTATIEQTGQAALGDGDQALDKGTQLLRLRHGGLDPLVADERGGLVAEQRNPVLRDPAQFSMCNSVTHRSSPWPD
jgi:hypothetical protein